jgi:hypothetical protein
MDPSQVKELAEDLIADLEQQPGQNDASDQEAFTRAVRDFYRDWQMAWTLYQTDEQGWPAYEKLRNHLLSRVDAIKRPLIVGSTGLPAQKVLLARILVACVRRPMPGMKTLQFAQ